MRFFIFFFFLVESSKISLGDRMRKFHEFHRRMKIEKAPVRKIRSDPTSSEHLDRIKASIIKIGNMAELKREILCNREICMTCNLWDAYWLEKNDPNLSNRCKAILNKTGCCRKRNNMLANFVFYN